MCMQRTRTRICPSVSKYICMYVYVCDFISFLVFCFCSGKTSLLFQFAYNSSAAMMSEASADVVFICKRQDIERKPPILPHVCLFNSCLNKSLAVYCIKVKIMVLFLSLFSTCFIRRLYTGCGGVF